MHKDERIFAPEKIQNPCIGVGFILLTLIEPFLSVADEPLIISVLMLMRVSIDPPPLSSANEVCVAEVSC